MRSKELLPMIGVASASFTVCISHTTIGIGEDGVVVVEESSETSMMARPTPTRPPNPTSPYEGLSEDQIRTIGIRKNAIKMGVPTPGPTLSKEWQLEHLGIDENVELDQYVPYDPNIAIVLPNGTPVYKSGEWTLFRPIIVRS
jgi:hypothetical protein